MLDAMLFFLELYILVYTAVHQWQQHGRIREAILAAGLSVLAFVILWVIISPLSRLVPLTLEQGVVVGPDSLGVVLTVALHLTFVRSYFFATSRSTTKMETNQ